MADNLILPKILSIVYPSRFSVFMVESETDKGLCENRNCLQSIKFAETGNEWMVGSIFCGIRSGKCKRKS
jgi:hypothetical protein